MLTKEQIEALLNGTTPGPWRKRDCDVVVGEGLAAKTICHLWRHWSNDEKGIEQTEPNAALTAAAPDLARTALDALARLADAQAAQALVVERAADMIEDNVRHAKELGREIWAMPDLRALADPSGVEALAALRAERDAARRQNDRLWSANLSLGTQQDAAEDRAQAAEADRDRLAAQLAEAQAAFRRRYARGHDPDCPAKIAVNRNCSCGWDDFSAALATHTGKEGAE